MPAWTSPARPFWAMYRDRGWTLRGWAGERLEPLRALHFSCNCNTTEAFLHWAESTPNVPDACREQLMNKGTGAREPWTKPEVKRLGEIKDVAHQGPGTLQGGAGKS